MLKKNGREFPDNLKPQSHKKYWWKHIGECGCTHSWYSKVTNMTASINGDGCKICSRHQFSEPCCKTGTVANDEKLMRTWDTTKNKDLDPSKLYCGSETMADWKCDNLECQHEWSETINQRRYHGCPGHKEIAPTKTLPNKRKAPSGPHIPTYESRSLASPLYLQIMSELDPDENINLDLRSLCPSSKVAAHWLCKKSKCGCEHRWTTEIQSRIVVGKSEPKSGCPYCCHPCQKICCEKHPRSLMQWIDTRKLSCIILGFPNVFDNLTTIHISSGEKIWTKCDICSHTFDVVVNNATKKDKPCWCPYCASRKLCDDDECILCFSKSLASWSNKEKLQSFENGGNLERARDIFLCSNKRYNFNCFKCNHLFRSILQSVTKFADPSWCPYCANKKFVERSNVKHVN
jgi:hypothetical protein